jgi:uncharacterized protein
MVRKGEYLERAVAFEGDVGAIEGLYHRGAKHPPLLVLPGDPFRGGSMEVAMVAEIAYAVTRRGHPTLRINYRGVGASAGSYDGVEGAVLDARRGLAHLAATTGAPRLAIAGIGMGADVAGRIAQDDLARVPMLILVAPGLEHLPEAIPEEVVVVVAEEEPASSLATLKAWAASRPGVRTVMIPGADRRFFNGLVDLGRVVAEAIAPPGMIDLG